MFLIALFEPCLYFIFKTLGLKYTSAPKASLIIATIGEKLTIIQAFAGIFVLFAVFLTNLPGIRAMPQKIDQSIS